MNDIQEGTIMPRETIDFGIDLGTTNSAIAVFERAGPRVLRNNEGYDYTPSAVWVGPDGALHVGRGARARLESDIENAFSEFKLQMGTDIDFTAARSGRRFRPEDLSAEVLKALKANVSRQLGEEIRAAVITVPAAFQLNQCQATERAAELAGLTCRPLVLEPVAAAMAYHLQNRADRTVWLVYDFRPGTFDAALVQVRDGEIIVLDHAGDNELGGKLIDWAIVEELLIPAVVKEHALTDFRRGNLRWRSAIAKLKQWAEEAKIQLSQDDTARIGPNFLCQDEREQVVEFEYELTRSEVSRLARPFIVRTVNKVKSVLGERKLDAGGVGKILLVGESTNAPYLREQLAEELNIPLEFSVDPLTVVAQGAAIVASTLRLSEWTAHPDG
jgi:molecular chaperone DnaK